MAFTNCDVHNVIGSTASKICAHALAAACHTIWQVAHIDASVCPLLGDAAFSGCCLYYLSPTSFHISPPLCMTRRCAAVEQLSSTLPAGAGPFFLPLQN